MAKDVVVNLKANTAQAEKNVEGLNKDLKETQADISGIEDAGDQMTGGMVSGFKGMLASVKSAITGLKTFRGALLATGIGAFVVAIGSVATALSNSEEGQNRLNKWLTQISVVIGNVTDILGNFGNAIISVFTGNFSEAKEALAAVTEGIKNFGEETKKEIKVAGELADMRAKADKVERDLLLERAEADRKFNELREKAADKENVAIADRIAALKEAAAIDEAITKKEIEAARLRFEAKKAENALSASTKEDLDEEAALQARLIELETARLKKAKTLTAEITTNLREAESERKRIAAEAKKAIDDENKAKEDAEKKLAEVKKLIRDNTAVSEQEKRDLQIIKIDEHFQKLKEQAIAQNLDITELENANESARQAKLDEFAAQDDARNKKAVSDQKLTDAAMVMSKRASIATIGGLMGQLSGLLGEGTAASKAAALAEILISSGVGFAQGLDIAQKSAKATGPAAAFAFPIFYATQVVAILTAIGKAKQILSKVKAPSGGGSSRGGGAVPSVSAPPTPPTPPDVTSVGGSGMNQLADAIGSQNQQPVQAFVVSNDVTTAQSLERNIVDGASIG